VGPPGPSPLLANALPVGHGVPPEPPSPWAVPYRQHDHNTKNPTGSRRVSPAKGQTRTSFTSGARPAALLARKRPKTVNISSQNPLFYVKCAAGAAPLVKEVRNETLGTSLPETGKGVPPPARRAPRTQAVGYSPDGAGRGANPLARPPFPPLPPIAGHGG